MWKKGKTYFEDEFVVIGINALLLFDDLTRCGLLCPGLRAITGTLSNFWSSGSLACKKGETSIRKRMTGIY